MKKPKTFQYLATKAHDMEVMIANHHVNSFGFTELKKDKAEFKRNVKFSKNSIKVAMSISTTEPIRMMGKLRLEDRKSTPFKDAKKEASHAKRTLGEDISIP